MLGTQKNQATEPYWDGGLLSFLRYVRTRISPHVVKSGFRNARNFYVWNSESDFFFFSLDPESLALESGIQLKES